MHSMYASLLRLHGASKALSEGMATHDQIIRSIFEKDAFLDNLVVQMYGKCGALREAHILFTRMHQRDVFTWTFIISSYAYGRQEREALRFFDCMRHEAVLPSNITFVEALCACGKASLVGEGKRIHACLVGSLNEWGVITENALLNFYGKCGSVKDAKEIFDKMKEKDTISWNTMLTAYNQQESHNEARQLFQAMLQQAFILNKITLTCLSDASMRDGALADSKRTHAYIVGCGLDSDVGVANTLVSMYARCGSLDNALLMFHDIHEPNVVSWTTIIAVHIQHKLCKDVFAILSQMLLQSVLPNIITFLNIISACASQEDLSNGKRVHTQVVACGYELDVLIGNALINLYGKCKVLENAKMIYDKMPVRDNVTWNSLITAYTQLGHSREVLRLFGEMHEGGISSDGVTLVCVLDACANELDLDEGKQVHACIYESWADLDSILGRALVHMYAKCGNIEDSREVFDKVCNRSVVLWTAMISAYVQHEQSHQATQIFEQMKVEGTIPDELAFCTALSACFGQRGLAQGKWIHACIQGSITRIEALVGNALLSMYTKCGSFMDSKVVFKQLVNKSVILWTTMITACAQNGQPKQALRLFDQMQLDGVLPNLLTFSSLLDACASLAAMAEGNRIYELILVGGYEPDVVLGTALVNLYSKCGSVEDAHRVFDRMPERNAASWNSFITAYCQLGDTDNAGQLFQQMQSKGVRPDEITFLTIISSLSHAGLVDEALDYFMSMTHDHALTPTVEHYNCLIDLFGRAGCLDKVEDMLTQLPCETTLHSWMSMLSACRVHVDVERGQRLAKSISKQETANHAPQVLLSNLYAAVGRFKEAETVRKQQ
eukprot:c25097_g16_i3 orf=100-2613(-)